VGASDSADETFKSQKRRASARHSPTCKGRRRDEGSNASRVWPTLSPSTVRRHLWKDVVFAWVPGSISLQHAFALDEEMIERGRDMQTDQGQYRVARKKIVDIAGPSPAGARVPISFGNPKSPNSVTGMPRHEALIHPRIGMTNSCKTRATAPATGYPVFPPAKMLRGAGDAPAGKASAPHIDVV
jgi:hypothetical protein